MKGQVIGKTMQHGYAGSYARQPDMAVDSEPLGGDREVPFGAPVVMGENGTAMAWAEDFTAENFWGVAVREVKSSLDFLNQNEGVYAGNNIALTNAQWKGAADANGVAELRILTILNV